MCARACVCECVCVCVCVCERERERERLLRVYGVGARFAASASGQPSSCAWVVLLPSSLSY